MGTWGVALYSDDLAADLKSDLRELIGDGDSIEIAVDRLLADHASSLNDPDEASVVWLAIADMAWRLGRPHQRATTEALNIIETGVDLQRWSSPKDRAKRSAVLADLEARLRSPAPPTKRVAKTIKGNNSWAVGEIVCFRLSSGSWTALRVIGHHIDKGGKHAVCELLDWVGSDGANPVELKDAALRKSVFPVHGSQIMVCEPRRRADAERFRRTGLASQPRQEPQGYLVFVFPHFDRQLLEIFGLE